MLDLSFGLQRDAELIGVGGLRAARNLVFGRFRVVVLRVRNLLGIHQHLLKTISVEAPSNYLADFSLFKVFELGLSHLVALRDGTRLQRLRLVNQVNFVVFLTDFGLFRLLAS